MTVTPEVSIALLEEKQRTMSHEMVSVKDKTAKLEERLQRLESITARNAVVVGYIERVGWATIAAATALLGFLKDHLPFK